MTSINQNILRIRQYQKDKKIAFYRLAKISGVSEGIIRNMHSEKWNPTLKTIQKLEKIIPADFNVQSGGNNNLECQLHE